MSTFLLKPAESPARDTPILPTVSSVTATKLSELDLDYELLQQYREAKALLDLVKTDFDTPTNQKAQILNTISSILANIVKQRQEVHNLEQMKLIESTLIEVLQNHQELKQAFLTDYQQALEAVARAT